MWLPTPGRLSRLVLAAQVLIAVSATSPARAVDILLTNDDGVGAVGIQTLRTALLDAGHQVTVVAPLANRSGSSAAVNLAPVVPVPAGPGQIGLLTLEELTVGGRAPVAATPASCVFFGLTVTLAGDLPDLVVSGTNIGSNVGTTTPFSGTVGAVTTALVGSVPAIAVSTDPTTTDTNDPAYAQHFADVADFAVRLIGQLEARRGALHSSEGLLPPRVGLNVNYPALPPNEVRGVRLAVQGRSSNVSLVYQGPIPALGGAYLPAVIPNPDSPPDVKDADTALLVAGYVTIVPVDADLTASPGDRQRLGSVLKGLEP